MPKLTLPLFINLCLLLLSQNNIAQARHNPAAHTHGLAQMTVLFEAGQLMIEIETPAANILGFERAPQDAEAWQLVKKQELLLQTPENILLLTPLCQLLSADVDLAFNEQKHEEKNIKPPHSLEKSTTKPKHEHKHDHAGSHDHSHKHSNSEIKHNDIFLNYAWQCDGRKPPLIKLLLFDRYSGFETINVQWLAGGKQGAGRLTKDHAVLRITP